MQTELTNVLAAMKRVLFKNAYGCYHQCRTFSPYGIEQQRARRGLALPQAWRAGDVSAGMRAAGVTRAESQPDL
jgi:hypothetical protein